MESVNSRAELKEFQRQMAGLIFQPVSSTWKTKKKTAEGDDIAQLASAFIKPNDRQTSFERLEIYNRCYWFRVLDSLYDDFPGLLALLGNRKFLKLVTAYLEQYPSESFTLRNLGSRLDLFILKEPQYTHPYQAMALDMFRFEWAQIVAFDGPAHKPVSPREIQKQSPENLRFGLQPYISLLALDHAVDHYLIAVKNQETDGLRNEASNTSNEAPDEKINTIRLAHPNKEKLFLAVHRYDNALFYKRLDPTAFNILSALQRGIPLLDACAMALNGNKKKDHARIQQELSFWFADWSSLGWLTPLKTNKLKKREFIS